MTFPPSPSNARRQKKADAYQSLSSASPPSNSPLQSLPNRTTKPTASPSNLSVRSGQTPASRSSRPFSAEKSDSPYIGSVSTLSIGEKFSFSPDPNHWGALLSPDFKEDDDDLHAPEPRDKRYRIERDGHFISCRGLVNMGTLAFICIGCVTLFAGYPIVTHFTTPKMSNLGGFNLGGINATGQVPAMPGNFGLIDKDTPHSAYLMSSWNDPSTSMELVFSDEFNIDGRTFYPGDDPYWEAVDLHYWATKNLEWYDPDAVITEGGNLKITLERKRTHNLNFQGGMITTWNKFCFTGGYIEANVTLPGLNNVAGLWPAIWTMGNLGRAGYGATLEGMWPYSYDACDVGTVANQTVNGRPVPATVNGDPLNDNILSFLPGQKLSRCTCPDANDRGLLVHPGPKHSDGTFVGRSAPEIDIFEAQISGEPPTGEVSQSAQFAPFNEAYVWDNSSVGMRIVDSTISRQNSWLGSVTQQATSIVTKVNQECYEATGGCFLVYGFEYQPGFDNAYITWVSDSKVAWTLYAAGVGSDLAVEISARPIPQEPMYIIVNLGMSHNFGFVDLEHIPFPVHMLVDYIRVYQRPEHKNIGCSPENFPTEAYINQYMDAYTNPNFTTWTDEYKQPFPGNSWLNQC